MLFLWFTFFQKLFWRHEEQQNRIRTNQPIKWQQYQRLRALQLQLMVILDIISELALNILYIFKVFCTTADNLIKQHDFKKLLYSNSWFCFVRYTYIFDTFLFFRNYSFIILNNLCSFFSPSECDSEWTSAPGIIRSPNYPDDYPNNALCNILITAGIGKRVLLLFKDMNIDYYNNCDFARDTLSIFEGNKRNEYDRIITLCGPNLPSPIESTGQQMLLVFDSDKSGTNSGFEVEFHFVEGTIFCTLTGVWIFEREHVSYPAKNVMLEKKEPNQNIRNKMKERKKK